MATVYVSSVDGSDVDNGSTWALAKATVAGAMLLCTDPTNTIYVDSAHSFTAGVAISWNSPTAGVAIAIISVDRNGSATTGHNGWLAGATEGVGAANASFGIGMDVDSRLFVFGMTINGATGNQSGGHITLASSADATEFIALEMQSCTLAVNSTNAAAMLFLGAAADAAKLTSRLILRNCSVALRNTTTGAAITVRDSIVSWIGTTLSYVGANKPANLFTFTGSITHNFEILDSDISGYEKSGGFLFDVAALEGSVRLQNVKLSGTPGLVTGSWRGNYASITLVNADSGDTHDVFEFRNRLGTLTEETSVYANSGAEFDGAGVSWKIVTTASCSEHEPFVTPWLHGPFSGTSAITPSIEFDHDSATALTNRTIWPEFEYLSSLSFPLGTLASGRFSTPFEGTAVDWAAGAATWAGTGGFTNENKQKLTGSFTPAEKSLLRARVSVGVASKTLYVDPWIRGAA